MPLTRHSRAQGRYQEGSGEKGKSLEATKIEKEERDEKKVRGKVETVENNAKDELNEYFKVTA